MIKGMTIAAALLALGITTAKADEPRAFSWTGFYVGGHVGYGSADWDANVAHPCNCTTLPFGPVDNKTFSGKGDIGDRGLAFGVQVGANKQFGTMVIGVELDVTKSSIEGDHTFRMDYDTDWAVQSKLDMFGTARIRLGHAMANGLMPYVTGGLAWARTEADMQTISITGPLTMSELSSKQWHVGWTIGAGAEYALGNGFSLKAEYLYMDLGKADYDPKGLAYAGTPIEFKHSEKMDADLTMHLFRIGANYKF